MSPVLSVVIAIAAVLLVGNLLIIGHELGHYAAARAVGVTHGASSSVSGRRWHNGWTIAARNGASRSSRSGAT